MLVHITSVFNQYEADVVVLATGYVQKFPFMEQQQQEGEGAEEGEAQDSALPSEHFILESEEPTIAYLG